MTFGTGGEINGGRSRLSPWCRPHSLAGVAAAFLVSKNYPAASLAPSKNSVNSQFCNSVLTVL